MVTLHTPRLELRPLTWDDFDALAALLGDAEALVHFGGAFDDAGVRAWIERNLGRYERDGIGRCAIVLRASGELVGDCGLIRTTVEDAPEVELGWIVRRSHWGQGIATEAGAAWRDHAFGALGLPRIVSMISEENLASRRVAEKLGLRFERHAVWDTEPMMMYSVAAGVRPS